MDAIRSWFFDSLAARMASVFEAMAGARPGIRCEALASIPQTAGSRWRQPFSGVAGAAWVVASAKDWAEAGNQVLRAAGIDDGDEPTIRSTYQETLGQVLAGIAQEMSARLGREVTPSGGEDSAAPAGESAWVKLHLQFAGASVELEAGAELALLESLTAQEPASPIAMAAEAAGGSKTFGLLLDVELPVSVSFGRAQVPLKDVIKLTTGSIVELNRSIAEPVEVIVNNCVIARGEVVVVEGNFGVRIQEVISQKERLRTLN